MSANADERTPEAVPEVAQQAVLSLKGEVPDDAVPVRGYSFDQAHPQTGGVNYEALLSSYLTSGFQATAFGRACEVVNKMIDWRLSDEPIKDDEPDDTLDPEVRSKTRCKIFLSYTSNMSSCGVRESLMFLVKNKMVDCVVTTAGGIEEDLIKCLGDTYLGDFRLNGEALRKKGLNRIGNLLVPNDNYCKFEDWIMPILDAMLKEQKENGEIWSPSKMIRRFGKEINDESSVLYWCYKNDIPVFSPALTDGSIGDMIYFHSYKNPGLICDIAQDIRGMNSQAVFARKVGAIILGGGVIKHHVMNACLMRNGADYSVFINTGQEFDGSDSGARPDEAISWGKIRMGAEPVKVYSDATLMFPLLVAQTFARKHFEEQQQAKQQ